MVDIVGWGNFADSVVLEENSFPSNDQAIVSGNNFSKNQSSSSLQCWTLKTLVAAERSDH